jgi:phosphohistidine phosphatase
MGAYMESRGLVPERVLCSTAKRTRETLDLLLPHFSPKPDLAYTRALYLADWAALLKQVHATPASCRALMIVGHNPGIERLAIALALSASGPAERSRAEKLVEKFPTAALAVLETEGADWSAFKAGSARLMDFVRPKDLDRDEGDA